MKYYYYLISLIAATSLMADQTTFQAKKAAEAEMAASITALQQAEQSGNKKSLSAARTRLQQAEGQYRAASYAHAQSSIHGMDTNNQERHVYKEKAELSRRKTAYTQSLVDTAKSRSDMSEADRSIFLSSNEASLRAMLIDESVNEGYVRNYRPVADRNSTNNTTVHDKKVDAKTARMGQLMERIEYTDTNHSNGSQGFAAEVDKMAKRVSVEHSISEFRELASSHTFRDPVSGKLLGSAQQGKVNVNAMKELELKVRSRAHNGGLPESFVNMFTGEEKDSRLALGGQLAYENKHNIAGEALQFIPGEEATPQQHFRAMSQVVHKRADELEDYFLKEYLPNANDGQDSVMSQWFNLGMGTASRVLKADGEAGVNTVRGKIDELKADAYRVSAALNAAASQPDPNLLKLGDRNLLQNYGLIKIDSNGKMIYAVPDSNRKLNSIFDANLPTSPWLDCVSVRTAAETGVAMATGSASASIASKMAQAGRLSSTGAAALTTLAEVTSSSAMDSLMNKAHGKDADFDKALLHNLAMSGLGKLTKSAGDEFFSRAPSWKEALDDAGKYNIFEELFSRQSGGKGDISLSSQLKRYIAETAGLSSEAAIETAYQAAAEGGPLTREAFMANLLSGAMSRTAGDVMRGNGQATVEAVIKRLPENLQRWATEHPQAIRDSIERAMKSNAHSNEAMQRFEAVKRKVIDGGDDTGTKVDTSNLAELYNNPAMADHVMESLANGDMRWSDLGIIAEKEGSVASELLHAVKDRRTEWAYGVGEPETGRVKDVAREKIEADYAKRIEEVSKSDNDTSGKAAAILALKNEKAAVLEQLGNPSRDQSKEGKIAEKAISSTSDRLFQEDVMERGVGKEVKERAVRELNREYALKKQDLMTGDDRPKTKQEMQQRLDTLEKERLVQEENIRKATMIAPGSGDPTSDIDRSWSEPRVVQSMKGLQRDRLLTEVNGVKGVGPTTAKAFDLNEYYNVMDGVKSAMPLRNDPKKGFHNELVEIEGVGKVTHDDAVAGNGLAAAMSHLSEEKLKLYKTNKLKEVAGDPLKLNQRIVEMQIAERALAESKERLGEAREKIAEKFGIDPNSPEAGIYARDLVYGETMRDVKLMDDKISKLPEGSSDWKVLQAQRERLMNQASRDGIEAYTDAAGLDVIVNRMQSKKNPDGSKMSVNDLWNDPKFNREGDLKHLSERQLDNMMNDQAMMISEHLSAHENGTETPHQTARALAKYGQRSALVGKMNGKDMPPGHPMREMYDVTSELNKYKGDPEGMRKALERFAGPGGSARDGVNKLRTLVENSVPGLQGFSGKLPDNGLKEVPKGFSSISSYRDWLRTRDELYNRGGQREVDRWLHYQQNGINSQRENLLEERAELELLGEKYLPEDFADARGLEENIKLLTQQINAIPRTTEPGKIYLMLLKAREERERRLKGLADKKDAYEDEHGKLPKNPDLEQIEKELNALDDKAETLAGYLKNGCRPPQIKAPIAKTAADELEEMLKNEFKTAEEKPVEGATSIVDGLNKMTEKMKKGDKDSK